MAEAKSKTKKSVKVIKKLRVDHTSASLPEIKEVKRSPYGFAVKLILIVVLGTVLYLLAQKYRGTFLAGTVNSSPISRWELNQKMVEKYGKQTLDEIVNERLLVAELKKNNITVTDKEIDEQTAKIIKEYGGEEAFKSALTQYGLTEAKAKDSIKQSLSLTKLIEKNNKIEITDDQVKKYFESNKTLFEGKKLEEVASNIKETLYQQEINVKIQEWFTGIRKSAKIVPFI
ncbi:MAG: Foldase protein PrsA [Microgenomates group bacterium GW2011_GWC1_44_37]|uniref:peptidylprolyl isomerase n=1 Tax=Candidatus Collierbacteria bacterium GW2011_GWB2_44_22 TaxID=1618387 RepID=A0A0G1I053_9BACT|nr:MAG: Foldase protein PrsA [Candidatus Collierbacteria bacterium GW2011_GWB2_44_22]KKT62347.1 MAG: Foldase protein PrsA [Candidatus Collierbacteria bacterium GW2011_GWD1_44_27]KKT65896.1 MAG: Foldase protein PrsA [Candidatus Collierbacteria bacterium GW2011_GWC2_44_30]KKT68637.1 MAG: Foldase protein PrsA [Microgenomates group bacterium GW2011_GWC1_44_37]